MFYKSKSETSVKKARNCHKLLKGSLSKSLRKADFSKNKDLKVKSCKSKIKTSYYTKLKEKLTFFIIIGKLA